MIACGHVRQRFSSYLDGDVPGNEMLEITRHLETCGECASEFAAWKRSQSLVSHLGPTKVPDDLSLRLRIAISRESQNSARERFGRFQVRWENTLRPLLLRTAAGFASALLLVGSAAMLINSFPQPVEARAVPLESSSVPRLMYSSFEPGGNIGAISNPVILQVFVDTHGRVYDYKVLSGNVDAQTRDALDNVLLFSVFEPARYFDQPVLGTAVMSFTGVSVKG